MPQPGTDLFMLACQLMDLPASKITAANLKERFGVSLHEQLLSIGALKEAESNQDVDVWVEEEDRSYPVQMRHGGLQYFSPVAGWTRANKDELLVYKVKHDWFLRVIMDALGIPANMNPQSVVDGKVWFIGSAWLNKIKTPIVFARTVTKQDVADGLFKYLEDQPVSDPVLVLTSSSHIPPYFQLPGQNRMVSLEDAVDREQERTTLKFSLLAARMGGSVERQGFSQGYRNALINGVHYEFTLLQAEIIEILDKAGRPMHKTEIMSQTSSEQEEVKWAFRTKGQYHPAWNVIIKNDKKGNYWLDY